MYPVKGCAAIELQNAYTTPTGLAFDRHWMVVNEDTGHFYSQRKLPRMALIQPELPEAVLRAKPSTGLNPGQFMTLSAPGQPKLQVSLDLAEDTSVIKGDRQRQCDVWEWSGPALDAGDEAASWLSSFLEVKARLVRYAGRPGGQGAAEDEWRRGTDKDWAPSNEIAFADGFPFLLIGQASLDVLNKNMDKELRINRFRPNIVVSTSEPFEEDTWLRVSIGGAEFQIVKPCDRCKVTTVEQETAVVGKEPLETLHHLREGGKLGWSEGRGLKAWTHAVMFGVYLVALQGSSEIAIGQAIQVQEKRKSGAGTVPWEKLAA